MLCALVLCVLLLSLNSSKAEGLPTMEARTVTRKFQNALTQQVKKKERTAYIYISDAYRVDRE